MPFQPGGAAGLRAAFGMTEETFEKDDDSNGHIRFVTAASNLRATNYGARPLKKTQNNSTTTTEQPLQEKPTAKLAPLLDTRPTDFPAPTATAARNFTKDPAHPTSAAKPNRHAPATFPRQPATTAPHHRSRNDNNTPTTPSAHRQFTTLLAARLAERARRRSG